MSFSDISGYVVEVGYGVIVVKHLDISRYPQSNKVLAIVIFSYTHKRCMLHHKKIMFWASDPFFQKMPCYLILAFFHLLT